MSTEEIKENISRIISKEVKKSFLTNNLNPDIIAEQIWKWLLTTETITVNAPEAACGCCEVND